MVCLLLESCEEGHGTWARWARVCCWGQADPCAGALASLPPSASRLAAEGSREPLREGSVLSAGHQRDRSFVRGCGVLRGTWCAGSSTCRGCDLLGGGGVARGFHAAGLPFRDLCPTPYVDLVASPVGPPTVCFQTRHLTLTILTRYCPFCFHEEHLATAVTLRGAEQPINVRPRQHLPSDTAEPVPPLAPLGPSLVLWGEVSASGAGSRVGRGYRPHGCTGIVRDGGTRRGVEGGVPAWGSSTGVVRPGLRVLLCSRTEGWSLHASGLRGDIWCCRTLGGDEGHRAAPPAPADGKFPALCTGK